MMEVQGKYNAAKIFTDVVDEKSVEQVRTLCSQEFVKGSRIRMMPDIHAGAGCTIGTTMTISDKIAPNLVGVDIGCGMYTTMLNVNQIDLRKLDEIIHTEIPSGRNIRDKPYPMMDSVRLLNLYCADHVNLDRSMRSIGTLGGGNHFIEVDADDEGHIYLVVHSGSRHLGLEVANHYQRAGIKQMERLLKPDIKQIVRDMKACGRASEIEAELKRLKSESKCTISPDLAYVSNDLFDRYIHDMKIVTNYAAYNRQMITDTIMGHLDISAKTSFHTIHNYIDTDRMILRKGAVSALEGEPLLIPMNMRDGSLYCIGKGNEDWNYSAPHGAGRLMSRTQARNMYCVEEFQESMCGIFTTSVNESTIDECPMAYKSMRDIIDNIGPTVEIQKILRPIYNFKASE